MSSSKLPGKRIPAAGSAFLLPRPRSFAGLALAGFALSVLLTFAMRAGDGGASVGFLFVCTIAAVPPPAFPGVLTTFAFEPIPVYVLVTIGARFWLEIVTIGWMAGLSLVRELGS